MNMNALTLQKLVQELQPAITKRLIRDVFLGGHHDLYLDLGDSGHLLLSGFPGRSRIVFANPPNEDNRTRLSWTDRYLLKAGIVSLSQVPHERVVEFVISKKDRLGGTSQSRLVCEMIGRYTNVILVDADTNTILGSLRQISSRQNRMREVMPSRPYEPPPALNRILPDAVTPPFLSSLFNQSPDHPEDLLAHNITGLDTLTAKEILHLAGITNQPKDFARLAETIKTFLSAPPFLEETTIVTDADGKKHISVIQTHHTTIEQTFPSVSQAIDAMLIDESVSDTLRSRQKNMARLVRDHLVILDRKIDNIHSDLKEAEFADQYEKYGNILMAHIPRIPPGAQKVTLPDLFDPDAPEIDIALNTKRTPAENAQEYLKRGRKAKKGAPILNQRLQEVQQEKDKIQTLLDELQKVKSEAQLDTLQTTLEKDGILKAKKPKNQTTKRRAEGDIHPRRYKTSDGWTVLVGRNNQENDKLTKGSARDDIFLHAQGCPGSHVIIKREGKIDNPSRNTLQEAASLAAYWSKARGAKTVPVNYTDVRYVSKPKGAPPGLVTIKNEKTIMAHPKEITQEDDA